MATKNFFFLFSRVLIKHFYRNPRHLHRKSSNAHASHLKLQKYPSLSSETTLIFNMEGALLKSSSLFPFFMLVAFEAGSLLRAILLFLLYPFVGLVSEEMGLKIMVMVCFFGIKKDKFRVGSGALHKFLLEDVGLEGFEVLNKCKRKVGVSEMPLVMVESFLRDYMEVDVVVGREIKVVCGYFVGLMEEKKTDGFVLDDDIFGDGDVVGISSFNKSLDHHLATHCKEIYLVTEADKRNWLTLPKDKYPKPLIFHDGRLATRPTPLTILAIFLWVPFGLALSITRVIISITLPHTISIPILSFSGLRLRVMARRPWKSTHEQPKGILYVCNHRTLLDPLYLSFALKQQLTAVTYSLSRMSEILAPIKTVRLRRDRDQDGKMMGKMLKQGDLVVCPEGTTCREPYLLRFSPLFAEMSDHIVPVAVDTFVTMFYGTTAGGYKCFDPFFFLMNPSPLYTVEFLPQIHGLSTCRDGEKSRIDVANEVQRDISNALDFTCTNLTRRDKYLILAGNEGVVHKS